LDKDFIGRDALLKVKLEKSARVLVGLEMTGRGVAREHYVVQKDGQDVGWVTSGMFGPTPEKFLAMAYVPRELAGRGTAVDVVIRGKPVGAVVVKKPFYVPAYRR
jgi:aminomethyltransferase